MIKSEQWKWSSSALIFRDDVNLDVTDGTVTVLSSHSSYIIRNVLPNIARALDKLSETPVLLSDLMTPLSPGQQTQLIRVLDRIAHLLARCVLLEGRELARIEPTVRNVEYECMRIGTDAPLKLSKFAFFRSRADKLVLESPLAKYRVVLAHPAAHLIVTALVRSQTADDLCNDELPVSAVLQLLEHLAGAGFVDVGHRDDSSIIFASDEDPILRQWEFHDLLFHSRSRTGRYDDPSGGTYSYRGEIPPQPAIKEPPDGSSISLPCPSWDDVISRDPTVTAVLETRTSVRTYGEKPLTLAQIGEFLYRVGRIRGKCSATQDAPYEVALRPYPCAGAAYELELYVTIQRCQGLNQGIFYYDPLEHRLVLLNDDVTDREAMLRDASESAGMRSRPDVLFTVTSRFQRLSWKYRAVAYAVTLRDTGVLYQTMYIVATAMGLAPCGLGSGNTDLAARALKLDYLRESSVGDFILGSRPEHIAYITSPGRW